MDQAMEDIPVVCARDLMQREVITVSPQTGIYELHRLFVDEEIHGAPVVGDDGVVHGVVSALDVLRVVRDEIEIEPEPAIRVTTYFRDELPYEGQDWLRLPDDPDAELQRRMQELTAADAMTRELVTVGPDATAGEVARTMLANQVHRVLVHEGRLLQGVITTFDLLPVLAMARPSGERDVEVDRDAQAAQAAAAQAARSSPPRTSSNTPPNTSPGPVKVEGLLQRSVISCTTHDTLERAAQLMLDHSVGCLPVIDEQGHIAGILTDRDICMASYTQGVPLRAISVATTMSKHVFSCTANEPVDVVERVMSEHKIHRMPVIDEQGHPIGIISLGDLARAAILGKLPASEVASAIAAVSAPRSELLSAT